MRQGLKPGEYGHSFVFLRYVWDGASVVGMKVADNGYYGQRTAKRSDWGFWIGCNLTVAGDLPPARAHPGAAWA